MAVTVGYERKGSMIEGAIRSSNSQWVHPVVLNESIYVNGPAQIRSVRIGCHGGYIDVAKCLIPELLKVLASYREEG